jgi:FkbM family methyltransferase
MLALLKNTIKKKIQIHHKFYIFLLFLKSGKKEYLKILIQLIKIELFNKNKRIILEVNRKKVVFSADNFYTISYFYNNYVPEKSILTFLSNYYLSKKNGIFLDVGGFIGLHSFIVKITNANVKVHIFEADKYKYKIIKKNISLNKFNNVYLNQKFLTSDNNFRNPNDFTNYTHKTTSINEYIRIKNISNIDILKMDIEGLEYYALDKVNFKKIKILLVEFHSRIINEVLKKDPAELIKKLRKNYNLFFINHRKKNNFKILKFKNNTIKRNKESFMLVCSNQKIKSLEKYLSNDVSIITKQQK